MTTLPEFFTTETLRASLPLRYLASRLGIEVDEHGRAICPFHDDHNPSFQIYLSDKGIEKWRCWACGEHGDCYDLIARSHYCSFAEAVAKARDYAQDIPESFENARPNPRTRPAPDPSWYQALAQSQKRLTHDIGQDWGWGMDQNGNLLFPHYDQTGHLTGVKVRAQDGRKWSWSGSSYPRLYGAWRRRHSASTLLCEGETDAVWAYVASKHIASPPHVLALPSGVHTFLDTYLDDITRGFVYLAFDNDSHGRKATALWKERLNNSRHPPEEVRVCQLPEDEDLRSAEPEMDALLAQAK